jgi:hypothetical protein
MYRSQHVSSIGINRKVYSPSFDATNYNVNNGSIYSNNYIPGVYSTAGSIYHHVAAKQPLAPGGLANKHLAAPPQSLGYYNQKPRIYSSQTDIYSKKNVFNKSSSIDNL